MFVRDRVALRYDLRHCPWIQFTEVHAERDGDEQHEHERQHARRRFKDAPQHDAPTAARQVVQHHDRQRADRDARPECEAEQVGAEGVGRIDKAARNDESQAHDADDERRALQAFERGGDLAGS